jgi:chromatin remodeling complex protein RSC6
MIKPQDKRKAEKIPALLNPDAIEQLKRHADELASDIDYVAGAIIEQYLSRLKPQQNGNAKRRGRKPKTQTSEMALSPKTEIPKLTPVNSTDTAA